MKITNKLNLPQPFVDAVTREYQYKDKQYSVTSLLKGTCQTLLERRHADEIEQDVSDMVLAQLSTQSLKKVKKHKTNLKRIG